MPGIDGSYDCTVKSPLGDQRMTVTVRSDGGRFTGTASGAMGSADIAGEVSGETLTWKQHISVPMPMTLDCTATVDGDTLAGNVGAGVLGSFPLSGMRVG